MRSEQHPVWLWGSSVEYEREAAALRLAGAGRGSGIMGCSVTLDFHHRLVGGSRSRERDRGGLREPWERHETVIKREKTLKYVQMEAKERHFQCWEY